jgi:hypothetical protein
MICILLSTIRPALLLLCAISHRRYNANISVQRYVQSAINNLPYTAAAAAVRRDKFTQNLTIVRHEYRSKT